jgi:hypothetical protein
MGYVLRYAPLLAAMFVTACCSGYPVGVAPINTTSLPMVSVPESVPIKSATGQTGVTWLEPTGAGKSWQEVSGARSQVEQAIRDTADRLNAVDYVSLSLPDFVSYTRALALESKDFTGRKIDVEAFGIGAAGEHWTLYVWQGPELPQDPGRRVVHRWIKTYVLYNMDTGQITLILATIGGEAHE